MSNLKYLKDLHGHTFEVTDWELNEGKVFPILHEGETVSLQSNTLSPYGDGFLLASYKGTYRASMYTPNKIRITCYLKLIKYNPKDDMRWKKEE